MRLLVIEIIGFIRVHVERESGCTINLLAGLKLVSVVISQSLPSTSMNIVFAWYARQ